MAPDSFRVGRADGQRKSLADDLYRHGELHRLIGDLNLVNPCSPVEVDLYAIVNRTLLPRDFYNYPPLPAEIALVERQRLAFGLVGRLVVAVDGDRADEEDVARVRPRSRTPPLAW
jgi:hypothetical protein